jgi:hypothetical protein
MKGINILILIGTVIFSSNHAFGSGNTDTLYKVLKIKTKGDYYVIHAIRNDSLFKIISRKASPEIKLDWVLLRKGKRYCFDFGVEISDSSGVEKVPFTGNASYLHVKSSRYFVDGKNRIKFEKRFHYRIYSSRNLIGLYYLRH